jgi:hypothetical protein
MHRFHFLRALVPMLVPMLAPMLAVVCFVPPAAADGPFTVSGIKVAASADSAVQARNAAIAAGRPEAWKVLYRRIARQQDWARQPIPAADQLQKLIVSYYPTNEKRSTTRYVADMTYVFSPDAVAKLMQASGIAYTVASAKRVLVIPMAPAYSRLSNWTAALASPRFSSGVVPFSVPLGDAADMKALGGLSFESVTWAAIAPVAARQHAVEAVLIEALPAGNKMTVSLRRLGPNQLPAKATAEVPLLQGAAGTYPSAADAAVRAMEDMWKNRAALDVAQKGRLTADLRTASLEQFAAAKNALATVPNVANVSIQAMDIGLARLSLSYLGGIDPLREALAQAGLKLEKAGGVWQLTPTDALQAEAR